MSEEKEINIFDLVKSINKKEYMFSPEMEGKLYNQFIVNKAFANCKDSVLFANMANQMGDISDQMHYDFYYYALPKGYRFGKWYKKHESEEIQLVMQIYNVSYRKACEIAGLLNEQQKEELEKVLFKGGRRDVS